MAKLKQSKSTAGQFALGAGLMQFGQGLQQQMANSAAERRQMSLLQLQREWNKEDEASRREHEQQLSRDQFDRQKALLTIEDTMARGRTAEDRDYESRIWEERQKPTQEATIKHLNALAEAALREPPGSDRYEFALKELETKTRESFMTAVFAPIEEFRNDIRGLEGKKLVDVLAQHVPVNELGIDRNTPPHEAQARAEDYLINRNVATLAPVYAGILKAEPEEFSEWIKRPAYDPETGGGGGGGQGTVDAEPGGGAQIGRTAGSVARLAVTPAFVEGSLINSLMGETRKALKPITEGFGGGFAQGFSGEQQGLMSDENQVIDQSHPKFADFVARAEALLRQGKTDDEIRQMLGDLSARVDAEAVLQAARAAQE